ncbi:MAG: GNAT family N-acetyltransferase [Solirubrobacteraceae bacterium]
MPISTLIDWSKVCIRPIRADDGPRLRASHARLSPESRYRRFLAAKPELTPSDARYLVEIDGSDHFALVATLDDEDESIIAVTRFIRLAHDPETAEFAIVVGDDFQGQGLATEMLARLAEAATDRGVKRFRATLLSDNVAVRKMLERLAAGPISERRMGAVSEIEIDLSADAASRRDSAAAMIAACA